jgi:hypothetical protein
MSDTLFDQKQRQDFLTVLTELKDLYSTARSIHSVSQKNPQSDGSHSLEHDLAVAAFAHAIARQYSESLARTTVAGALMHSYDRNRRSAAGLETYDENDVRQWADLYLSFMTSEERAAVVEAVLAHDKPNKGKITSMPTTGDVLADADKLANIMLYNFIRLGQFAANKPPLRVGNLTAKTPGSTYRHYNVVLDDAFSRIEWLDDLNWFVTKEAKQIAPEIGKPWRDAMKHIEEQFRVIGLTKLPDSD